MKTIYNDLRKHSKIRDVTINENELSCEVDRTQSAAKAMVSRIIKPHGTFKITSTTKNTKNLGYTKVLIQKENI
jgi:hypothetical protein